MCIAKARVHINAQVHCDLKGGVDESWPGVISELLVPREWNLFSHSWVRRVTRL